MMRAVSQLILGVRSTFQAGVKTYNKGTPGTGVSKCLSSHGARVISSYTCVEWPIRAPEAMYWSLFLRDAGSFTVDPWSAVGLSSRSEDLQQRHTRHGRVRVSVVARREGDFVVHVRAADSGSRGDVLVAVSPCREARVGAF